MTPLTIGAVTLVPEKTPLLLCNGGGKDSLLMARLLDDRDRPFDSFSNEDYIQQEFISNLTVFSLLKPMSDPLVYRLLSQKVRDDDLKLVYSCNTSPPWCKSCPKCAYVYLSYMAYVTPEQEKELQHFLGKENLFDRPDLQLYYRQLMGLEPHNAFECVGEIEENKLALEKCVERGFAGEAISSYIQEARLDKSQYQQLWKNFQQLDLSYQRLPPKLMEILIEECQELAKN